MQARLEMLEVLKVVMAAVVHSQRNLKLIGTPRSKHIKARILGTKKLPLTFYHKLCGRFYEITVIRKAKLKSFSFRKDRNIRAITTFVFP